MKILPLPPLELLEHLFEVDETSPSGLRWKNPRASRIKPGEIAGCQTPNKYWTVRITTDRSRLYYAHRIAFYLLTKRDPGSFVIDHKTGIDNPLDIRIATQSQNTCNCSARKNTSSQFKGVYWHKQRNKWAAQIKVNNKHLSLGLFCSEIDAAKAYNKAASFHFKEFAKLNNIPE